MAQGKKIPIFALFPLFFIFVLLIYYRSLKIYFSGDDWVFLYGALRGLDLPFIFRFSPGSFAPLINLFFWAMYSLFKLKPFYYHIAVLFIHTINCILMFSIIHELSQNKKLALISSLLFSFFSPYNQIVIWLSGLAGLITSGFFLSSFYNFVIYRKNGKRLCFILSFVNFIFSLLCKEWAITVFALFILYDIIFRTESSEKSIAKRAIGYIPFIVIIAVYLSAELILPYSGKKNMFGIHIFSNLAEYLTKLVIPSLNASKFPLKALIPLLQYLFPPLAKAALAILILSSIVGVFRGPNLIKFFILWIYINLLPFLFFPWGTASRYYYIPAMGFIAVLSYASLRAFKFTASKFWKKAAFLCLIIFIISHLFLLEIRIERFYRTNENIRLILTQLKNMHPEFPPNSRLFFTGFQYDRKWGYAVRTIYCDPGLVIYRTLPSPEDLKDTSGSIFIFNYSGGFLREVSGKKSGKI